MTEHEIEKICDECGHNCYKYKARNECEECPLDHEIY